MVVERGLCLYLREVSLFIYIFSSMFIVKYFLVDCGPVSPGRFLSAREKAYCVLLPWHREKQQDAITGRCVRLVCTTDSALPSFSRLERR